MGRVEITGQFNSDNPACSNSQACQIERHPSSIPTASIRSWNGFCDSVDEALAPLTKIKMVAKISSALTYAVLVFYVVGLQLLPRIMHDFDYGLLRYSAVVFFPLFIIYGLLHCFYIRKGLVTTMEKVSGVCEIYSAREGGVKYALENEHWGGCNKPHVKKWYIVVNVDEEANSAEGVDHQIETAVATFETSPNNFSTTTQQQISPPMAVAEATPYFSAKTTQQASHSLTADATPTSRLEEMLN